jgi:hypothetical protein
VYLLRHLSLTLPIKGRGPEESKKALPTTGRELNARDQITGVSDP